MLLLWENDNLPLWRGPVVKRKPTFFNVHVPIRHEIMHSRDAQYNTRE